MFKKCIIADFNSSFCQISQSESHTAQRPYPPPDTSLSCCNRLRKARGGKGAPSYLEVAQEEHDCGDTYGYLMKLETTSDQDVCLVYCFERSGGSTRQVYAVERQTCASLKPISRTMKAIRSSSTIHVLILAQACKHRWI